MMIYPGLVSVTFKEKTAEEVIDLCRKAGLEAIEWSENSHVAPSDEKEAERLYECCKKANLKIAAYGSYFRFGQHENAEERFRASLVCAKAMHAPVIRIWAGRGASEEIDDKTRKEWAEEARKACDLAAEAKIKVALEWHRNTLTDRNESAVRFLKEVSHENLYCLWQPTVALNMQQRTEGIDLIQSCLLNLHTYYWLDGIRRPFAEGLDEWRQYLSHVKNDRERYALLEFVMDDSEQQLLEDAESLKLLLEEYNKTSK